MDSSLLHILLVYSAKHNATPTEAISLSLQRTLGTEDSGPELAECWDLGYREREGPLGKATNPRPSHGKETLLGPALSPGDMEF